MTGPVVEYGPSRTRSALVLIVFALAIGGLIWLAADAYFDNDDEDFAFISGMLILAALLAVVGVVYWRKEPDWQARLTISSDGVTLEQWKGETVPPTQAAWAEIATLQRWRTRRTTFYGIELQPDRAGSKGRVIAVAGSGLEPQSLNPLAAMEEFAREAGFEVIQEETARGRKGRDRLRLSAPAADAG
ncbi:MAG: hypothetical protein AAGG09_07985 [Pseudomonadota bacterium]